MKSADYKSGKRSSKNIKRKATFLKNQEHKILDR